MIASGQKPRPAGARPRRRARAGAGGGVADAAAGEDDHAGGEEGDAVGGRLDKSDRVHAQPFAPAIEGVDEVQGDEREARRRKAEEHVGLEPGGVVLRLALVAEDRAEDDGADEAEQDQP